MKKIKYWIKLKLYDLLEISKIRTRINENRIDIQALQKIIKERTEYHVDVHQYAKRNSQVILIGKFRDRDFVKCYSINDSAFEHLIHHCRELEKYAQRGKIDAIPEFHYVLNNKLDEFGY